MDITKYLLPTSKANFILEMGMEISWSITTKFNIKELLTSVMIL